MVEGTNGWTSLARVRYLAEAIAEASDGVQVGPGIPGIGPTIAGMQVGSLIGGLSRQIPAAFESGYPVEPPGPLLVIGPGVERVVKSTGAAAKDIRLWVAAEEVAHRTLFGVPWLTEHLARLVGAYSTHLLPDPEKLMKMFSEDTDRIGASLATRRSGWTCSRRGAAPHRRASRFPHRTSGYSHLLAKRAVGSLCVIRLIGFPRPRLPEASVSCFRIRECSCRAELCSERTRLAGASMRCGTDGATADREDWRTRWLGGPSPHGGFSVVTGT